MEFDAPLMFAPQGANIAGSTPNVRPYYKHDDFDRGVAESMPELGGRVFPGSTVASAPIFDHSTLGRIRRKSETCV